MVQPPETARTPVPALSDRLPVLLNEISYLTLNELADELDISRQTLWRWRREGKVPPGLRDRRNRALFGAEDAELVREFANQLEPAVPPSAGQLKLFTPGMAKRGGNR